MRTFILAVFAFVASGIGQAHAEATLNPALGIAGLPSTDHAWSLQEFHAAAAAISTLSPAQAPRIDQPGGAVFFDRLTDPAILTACSNRNTPLDIRLGVCGEMLNGCAGVLRLYSAAIQTDSTYSDEAMRVMGFTLRASATLTNLMEELLPTIQRSDPTYATRMQGVATFRTGITQVVQGALMSLTTDRWVYSDASSIAFARILAETYPTLSRDLPPDVTARFAETLAAIARNDPSADVRAALSAYAVVAN